jgi:hypothetical protein
MEYSVFFVKWSTVGSNSHQEFCSRHEPHTSYCTVVRDIHYIQVGGQTKRLTIEVLSIVTSMSAHSITERMPILLLPLHPLKLCSGVKSAQLNAFSKGSYYTE